MKIVRVACLLLAFLFVALSPDAVAADKKKAAVKAPPGMAALPLELPKPAFVGTPQNIKGVKQLEKPLGRPRPRFRTEGREESGAWQEDQRQRRGADCGRPKNDYRR